MPEQTVIRATAVSTWMTEFRLAEQEFFDLDRNTWKKDLGSELNKLHTNYDRVHGLHVTWLNQRMRLSGDPLRESHFDGKTKLQDLRDKLVAPRLPSKRQIRVVLGASADELAGLGLGHLVS